jgi:uncharacterized membrane protein (DUF485 family)
MGTPTVDKKARSHERFAMDPDFKAMVSARTSIVSILTILTLIFYYGFILLMAYGKEFLSRQIAPNITIGLPIGVAVIVVSWILTYTYANWANKKYDTMVENLKDKLGG